MLGTVTIDATGDDLAALGEVIGQGLDVFIVNGQFLVGAKAAYSATLENPFLFVRCSHGAVLIGN
jgi:hypothetical protein